MEENRTKEADKTEHSPDKSPVSDWVDKPASGRGYLQSLTTSGAGNNPYVNFSAHLFTDPWEKNDASHKEGNPLYKSFGGRVATRVISRGLFGAAFMTLGSVAVRTWDPHEAVEDMRLLHKGMTYLSRGFDMVLGTPIKAAFGEGAVTFRTKKTFSDTKIKDAMERVLKGENVPVTAINGRSLGQEMVGITFDFAAGSFGDALGRELVAVADPNYHTDWLKDGHVNFGTLAKDAGKSLWRMVSYNQMEDWAAALPYAYQMRAQRHLLGHAWPGAKFTLDHQNNGGSFVVDDAGQIKGSYMAAGALDLQARFMGYNFYTLMFRDLYNHAALKLNDWKHHGYQVHLNAPRHPVNAAEHAVGETVKYVAKSFMKSMLYMAPAVPFFWMFRTPISRSNGMFVSDKDNGGVVVKKETYGIRRGDDGGNYIRATEENGKRVATAISDDLFTVGDHIAGKWENGALLGKDGKPTELYLHGQRVNPEYLSKDFDPYHKKYVFNAFEAALNPFGRLTQKVAKGINDVVLKPFTETKLFKSYFAEMPYVQQVVREYPQVMNRYNLANTYVNAAMSYTPYMIAKYETANHIDMPLFDAAAYRLLDGIDTLKWRDIKEGVHDMASVVVRGPITEGTIAAAKNPRGLVNSSFEAAYRNEKHQEELNKERHAKKEAHRLEEKIKNAGGWAPYEVARAQGKENGAPEGVTIH